MFAKMMQVEEAINAVKLCLKDPLKLVVCSALDLLFFFSYGWLSAPIFDKLTDHVILISTLVSDALKTTGRAYVNNKSLLDILLTPPIGPFFIKFFVLFLLLGFVTYFLYCVLQGTIWKLSSDFAGYNLSWHEYVKSFARINATWFGLFVLYYFGDLFVRIRTAIVTKLDPSYVPSSFWSAVIIIVTLIVAYFVLLSYVSGGVKIGVRAGVLGWRGFAPALLLVMLIFLVIDVVMLQAGLWRLEAAYLLGLVLFLPALTISKVYVWRVAQQLSNNGVLPQY